MNSPTPQRRYLPAKHRPQRPSAADGTLDRRHIDDPDKPQILTAQLCDGHYNTDAQQPITVLLVAVPAPHSHHPAASVNATTNEHPKTYIAGPVRIIDPDTGTHSPTCWVLALSAEDRQQLITAAYNLDTENTGTAADRQPSFTFSVTC